MDTSNLFEEKSDLYASSRPLYPENLFKYISSLPDNHDCVWDCATGNGQAALGLSQYFSCIEATDISNNQILNSFNDKKINYSVQPAEKTVFKDCCFDIVNVAQALHWFDLETFWKEVKRVLKPSGFFITYSYSWSYVNNEIDFAVKKYIRDIIKPYWAPNNKLCWQEYQSIQFPFETLKKSSMEIHNSWNFQEYMDYINTWSGFRSCVKHLGNKFFETAEKKIGEKWGDLSKKKLVKTPLSIIAGNN